MKNNLFFLLVTIAFLTGCNNGPGTIAVNKKDTIHIKDTVVVIDTVKMPVYSQNTETRPVNPVENVSQHQHYKKVHHRYKNVNNTAAYSHSDPAEVVPGSADEKPVKKGWSAAAKDATIGGAVGAAAGAIIDKKSSVTGGIIGSIIGAGGGYLIGRSRDRKTGRVVKHKPKDITDPQNQNQ